MSEKPRPGGTACEVLPSAASPAPQPRPNSRQDPRLPLEFPVLVRYEQPNGELVRCNCNTVYVSVSGAQIALASAIGIGQSIRLTNVKTAKEVECTVRSVQQKGDLNLAGIAFEAWAPEFWEITFPRQAGDPPNQAAASATLPRKTLFGRVGPMPESPGQDDVLLDTTEDEREQNHLRLIDWARRHKLLVFLLVQLLIGILLWFVAVS